MDLTSGVPFWLVKDGLPATYPKLDQDRRCDVAIIGGGITGALLSQRFAKAGSIPSCSRGGKWGTAAPGRPPPCSSTSSTPTSAT